ARTAWTSSGSRRSAWDVKPTRSANRTVTILRSVPPLGRAPASGVAHCEQNFAPDSFSWLQFGQTITHEAYDARRPRPREHLPRPALAACADHTQLGVLLVHLPELVASVLRVRCPDRRPTGPGIASPSRATICPRTTRAGQSCDGTTNEPGL